MPFVTTTSDQTLTDDILTIDTYLSLTLDPNKEYVVQVLYRWDQAASTYGGLQCSLAINGTGSTLAWTGSFDTVARATNEPISFLNQSGSRLVTMTGIIITASVYTIVSAYRAQARADVHATNIRSGSVLQAGQVGQPFIPSNASLFVP